jgi:hypothetical protein
MVVRIRKRIDREKKREQPSERFPKKWTPVFRKKARQNKKLEHRSDAIKTENALGELN